MYTTPHRPRRTAIVEWKITIKECRFDSDYTRGCCNLLESWTLFSRHCRWLADLIELLSKGNGTKINCNQRWLIC